MVCRIALAGHSFDPKLRLQTLFLFEDGQKNFATLEVLGPAFRKDPLTDSLSVKTTVFLLVNEDLNVVTNASTASASNSCMAVSWSEDMICFKRLVPIGSLKKQRHFPSDESTRPPMPEKPSGSKEAST